MFYSNLTFLTEYKPFLYPTLILLFSVFLNWKWCSRTKQLKKDYENCKKRNNELETNRDFLSAELKHAELKCSEHLSSIEALKNEKLALSNKNSLLLNTRNGLKSSNDELKKSNEELETLIASFKAKNRDLTQRFNSADAKHKREVQSFQSKINSINTTIKEMQLKFAEAERQRNLLVKKHSEKFLTDSEELLIAYLDNINTI